MKALRFQLNLSKALSIKLLFSITSLLSSLVQFYKKKWNTRLRIQKCQYFVLSICMQVATIPFDVYIAHAALSYLKQLVEHILIAFDVNILLNVLKRPNLL